uniref:Uncharacterized protein n=1 Tax=Cacopsylla melanoneura TaxID=428564 RepID=A0A8D9AM96_9HEMI
MFLKLKKKRLICIDQWALCLCWKLEMVCKIFEEFRGFSDLLEKIASYRSNLHVKSYGHLNTKKKTLFVVEKKITLKNTITIWYWYSLCHTYQLLSSMLRGYEYYFRFIPKRLKVFNNFPCYAMCLTNPT